MAFLLLGPRLDHAPMSINPLIPLAGAYAVEAVQHLAQPLSAGVSFAQALFAGSDASASTGPLEAPDTSSSFRFDRSGQAGPVVGGANRRLNHGPGTSLDTQRRIDDFQSLLGQRMMAAGLDPFASMRLRSDAFGRLELVGDHRQATEIETLLSHDPALSQAFQELVELFQRLHASAAAPSGSAQFDDSPFGLGSWKQTAPRKPSPIVEFAIDRESINVSVSG